MTPLSGTEMTSTAAANLLGGDIVKWVSASALAADLRVAGFSGACDTLGEASPQWLAIQKHLSIVRPDNPGVLPPAHDDGEIDTDDEGMTEEEGNGSEDDDGAEENMSAAAKPAKKEAKQRHGLFRFCFLFFVFLVFFIIIFFIFFGFFWDGGTKFKKTKKTKQPPQAGMELKLKTNVRCGCQLGHSRRLLWPRTGRSS
jgi:hypothetical protein